jgi:hypothetical protein
MLVNDGTITGFDSGIGRIARNNCHHQYRTLHIRVQDKKRQNSSQQRRDAQTIGPQDSLPDILAG